MTLPLRHGSRDIHDDRAGVGESGSAALVGPRPGGLDIQSQTDAQVATVCKGVSLVLSKATNVQMRKCLLESEFVVPAVVAHGCIDVQSNLVGELVMTNEVELALR